jgi:hypothetical protein
VADLDGGLDIDDLRLAAYNFISHYRAVTLLNAPAVLVSWTLRRRITDLAAGHRRPLAST